MIRALRFPRGTNERMKEQRRYASASGADVRENKERPDEDKGRDAGVRRTEEKQDEEEKKRCDGEEKTEVPQAAATKGTRPPRSVAERHGRREFARCVPGGTWLGWVCDCFSMKITE
ncbi:hypothetical protein NDU88_006617 [Pleurodeles waltl]|uniref:Uncharacterized protein n=1 Tax=Pleurodeles waltl TaxID=8319 RepID=A0AAV7WF00_PLEWA|nr:hypothetical protein NDU88_006617 [Pleurodeles waltl]